MMCLTMTRPGRAERKWSLMKVGIRWHAPSCNQCLMPTTVFICIEYINDADLEEELQLPKDLQGLSNAEKRELLVFKQNHNEIEWEEELLARTDRLRKFRDLEELNKLRAKGTKAAEPVVEPKSKSSRGKSKPAAKRKAARVIEESEEGEEEESDFDGEGEEDVASDDEDWFDNEEVERITALTSSKGRSGKKSRAVAEDDEDEDRKPRGKKSRLDEHSDDSEGYEGYASDDLDMRPLSKKRRDNRGSPVPTRPRRVVEKPPSPEAQLQDILRIQIRRDLVTKIVNEAYFEEVMTGSFVRLVSHPNPEDPTTAVYKMLRVVEIKPFNKEYVLEEAVDKTCNKVMVLDDGSGNTSMWRNIKMSRISNSRIADLEFNSYKRKVEASGGEATMPTVDDVDELRNKNIKATMRVLEEKDVLKAVRGAAGECASAVLDWVCLYYVLWCDRCYFSNDFNFIFIFPILGFEQTQTLTQGVTVTLDLLERQLLEARAAHDHNQAERIQRKINKINLDIGRAKQKYEQSGRLSNINQRNRDLNIQMDNAAAKRKKENELKSIGTEKEADPFARRETRPKILWITGNKKTKLEEKSNQGIGPSMQSVPFYLSSIFKLLFLLTLQKH